jgi:urease accessory protein
LSILLSTEIVDHPSARWQGELTLRLARDGAATRLTQRRHLGPILVQKPLYPEGDEVCHLIIVHPPGGIAAGDHLTLEVGLEEGARALLTTPGATKWYKSSGARATQAIRMTVAPRAALEWLPQENIVFNAADALNALDVDLASGGAFVTWDISSLGRGASGEAFAQGCFRVLTNIRIDGRLVWTERGRIEASSRLTTAPLGLARKPVFGTLLAVGRIMTDDTLECCRRIEAPRGDSGAVTRVGNVFCARYVGDSVQVARRYFTNLWDILRPMLIGRAPHMPRIWLT